MVLAEAKVLFSALKARVVSTEAASRSNEERFASCSKRSRKTSVEEWRELDTDGEAAVEVWNSSILRVVKLKMSES